MDSKNDLPLMTVQELKQFDGKGESGKLFVAVCGKVYDVTDKGMDFYKPGGPYEMFAGRDASRGLATMSTSAPSDHYDSLKDLTEAEQESLVRWEKQFADIQYLSGLAQDRNAWERKMNWALDTYGFTAHES